MSRKTTKRFHEGRYIQRQQALDLVRSGETHTPTIARQVGVTTRTIQRWFHEIDFRSALDSCPGPTEWTASSHERKCPNCEGTGKIGWSVYFARLEDG